MQFISIYRILCNLFSHFAIYSALRRPLSGQSAIYVPTKPLSSDSPSFVARIRHFLYHPTLTLAPATSSPTTVFGKNRPLSASRTFLTISPNFHPHLRGRFPRVFGDKFGDKFSDKFGDKFSDSPNLVTNVVINLVTNLVNHQSWC